MCADADTAYGYRYGKSNRSEVDTWVFNSIKFSLFPVHINCSYNNDNVFIMCSKRGGLMTVLMKVRPLTITCKL